MEEEWRDVVGYEGLYKVSNLGRVKSLFDSKHQARELILKQWVRGGYWTVGIFKNQKIKFVAVHRLVAMAFISNDDPKKYPILNHKDENKLNNNVENLEWCDFKYNSNYGTSPKRIGEALSIKINKYTMEGELIETFPSMSEAERQGYVATKICACCRGRRKSHRGFIWRYA